MENLPVFHPPSVFLLYLARKIKLSIHFDPNQNALFVCFLLALDLKIQIF